MSIHKVPERMEAEATGVAELALWPLVSSSDEPGGHPAGINVWVRTPKGHVYEAQFSTDEVLQLVRDQLVIGFEGVLTVQSKSGAGGALPRIESIG